MSNERIFAAATESDVTRAIVRSFAAFLDEWSESDCVIVGGGPAGLVAGLRLAEGGARTLLVERNNYLGGGFWIGGYLMNTVTVRSPGEKLLDEIGIPHREVSRGLHTADGPHACSRLIAAACDAGVRVLNMTTCEDLVLRDDNRVSGVVINWTPVESLPRQITCVDPIALETKMVVDATGHSAAVAGHLQKRGLLSIGGCGAMNVNSSEDAVVQHTGEVFSGLVVAGMAAASVYGLPRMGPTFGGMFLSGERAARLILDGLARAKASSEPAGVGG